MDEGVCRGVTAWKLDDGTLHRFSAQTVILATGGYGRAYFLLHLRPHLHRRRRRHGAARRPAAAGHGVRPVPPHRHLRRRLPDHRGCAGRGRIPDQFRGRAVHGALRSLGEGPRAARHGQPGHDHRNPRGPGRRSEEGPHLPASGSPRSGGAARAPAGDFRDRAHLRRGRRDQGPHPRPARPSTTTWAASRRTSTARSSP